MFTALHQMTQMFKVFATISIVFYMAGAQATPCTEKFGIDEWAEKYREGLRARSGVLSDIRSCVGVTPGAAGRLGVVALTGLKVANAAQELTDEQRMNFIRFNANLLWVLAEGNDPTAQHNLAVLHNAQAGTFAQRAIKQDQSIFMYWTRRAASQGEPQAIFNLAMRLSRGAPAIGVAQNLPEAYTLFHHLEQINSQSGGAIQHLLPAALEEKKRLTAALGPSGSVHLGSEVVDFTRLAPTVALDNMVWNSEDNIRAAVARVYALVGARDESALWDSLQACYADALGLRTYMKTHEYCLALDIATTQWFLGFHQHSEEKARKPLAKQYEKTAFLNRTLSALLQAGLTEREAAGRFLKISEVVARETERLPESLRKFVKASE